MNLFIRKVKEENIKTGLGQYWWFNKGRYVKGKKSVTSFTFPCTQLHISYYFLLTVFFQKQPPKRSVKKALLENFTIFTGKYMCSSLSNTMAGLQACNFIKKRLQCRCFPANIAKLLRTSVLKNTCERQPILIFLRQYNVAVFHITYSVFSCLHPFTRS